MIASLTGTVVNKDERGVLLDVHGVGFRVEASSATIAGLPAAGKETVLLTVLHFSDREGFVLFGFGQERERVLFLHLIDVPGVGPRAATTILSAASVDELEGAIAAGDEALLTRVSGIGRKKAQKILVELKERYEDVAAHRTGAAGETADLLDALRSMGYEETQARTVVRGLPKELVTLEERLREAIKQLGSSR
jgi:Holliday junction DNA helicase RuvA